MLDPEAAKSGLEEMQEHALDYAATLVLPAMAASLLVMLVVRWIGGRRLGPLATLLAMSSGVFMAGAAYQVLPLPSSIEPTVKPYLENQISLSRPWLLESSPEERPWDMHEILQVLGWTLEGKKPPAEGEEPAANPPPMPKYRARYWIPYLAGLAMLVEFFMPLLLASGPAWTVRTLLALFAGRLLTRDDLRLAYPWLPWAMGLAILLEWGLLVALAKRWRDGVVPTAMTLCLILAGGVLMLSTLTASGEYALLFAAALAGPALVAWVLRSDTSPGLAVCAVVLPGLMLEGLYYSLPVDEPLDADVRRFWSYQLLAALAPLALLPMWLPSLARLEGWKRWVLGLTLPLIPAVAAVVWVGV